MSAPRNASVNPSQVPPTPGALLRAYAVAELGQAIACLGWRGGRLHAGVHQARKSIRRTRATLALGMPALGAGAELIGRELRRINTELSKLRDSHAVVVTLDGLVARTDIASFHPFLRRARRLMASARAERARSELARDPALARRRDVLRTLHAALPALLWDRVTDATVQAAIERTDLSAEAARRAAREGRSDEDWHCWRRRARRLSQQHRALGETSGPWARHEKRSKRLALVLGQFQDVSLLWLRCGRRSLLAAADRSQLRALADNEHARLMQQIDATLRRSEARPEAAETTAAAPA